MTRKSPSHKNYKGKNGFTSTFIKVPAKGGGNKWQCVSRTPGAPKRRKSK